MPAAMVRSAQASARVGSRLTMTRGMPRRRARSTSRTPEFTTSEDPATIRAAILAGTSDATAEVVEIGDRRTAIREALRRAGTGDIVLIAGKGHETGQEIAGEVHPFDDRDVVREELGAR